MTDRKHFAILDRSTRDDTHSWFCNETVSGNCSGEGFGFDSEAAAAADAMASGHRVATEDEIPGRYDGIPGLVWYSRVTKTRGDQLKVGDWLDSLDHRGARSIYGIRVAQPGSGFREVCFSGGWTVYEDGSSDTEIVRDGVLYDVVDPDSLVDPAGGR